jgi:hypothetical protein
MSHESGIIFGILDYEVAPIARILGFNNDGTTPSFAVPREIGEGVIYHAKPSGGKNIVVANAVLSGQNEQKYFFRTFDGMDPIEMDNLPREEARSEYEMFMREVVTVVSPEFQVTSNELKKRLEQLLEDF